MRRFFACWGNARLAWRRLSAERSSCGQLFPPAADPSKEAEIARDQTPALGAATLNDEQRQSAMRRFAVLQPHLEGEVPLARAAYDAGVPLRTAQRWLTRYRELGLAGLARAIRGDAGAHRTPAELVALIEGMALKKPRASAAAIHRRIGKIAPAQGWRVPSYSTVYAILAAIDPAAMTLAHEGAAAFRDRFEMIHRHRANAPNAVWQADHTMLDLLILDQAAKPARPWLTTVIDDHSRALAGVMAFIGAPSILNTSLALRHAIWRKVDSAWPVCGIPDVLYVDHGSDFTSNHLDQVAADLRFRVIYSAVARPQGRGKVERLFGTLNSELLPELPGHLVNGKPTTPAALSLSDLDRAITDYIVSAYNVRVHSEIGQTPLDAWRGKGFLPRLPESLEELDLLLVMHAKPRAVRRDGIRFQGLRYSHATLAAYVGETVTIRYDPRDLSEIRVFHRNQFLCRAVSEEHAGELLTLKDIQAARRAHRQSLRTTINERVARVADFLPGPCKPPSDDPKPSRPQSRTKLRLYREGD
jgi:putative transposase